MDVSGQYMGTRLNFEILGQNLPFFLVLANQLSALKTVTRIPNTTKQVETHTVISVFIIQDHRESLGMSEHNKKPQG